MARKSWNEKLQTEAPSEVKVAPVNFADIKAGQKMLLPSARDLADVVKAIPKGKQFDLKLLRSQLARNHGAEIACPVVTGIRLRILAEVAGEQLDAGIAVGKVVPIWRALGPKSPSWKKLENGRSKFEALRRAEGLED
jgi:hypothetical protein